MGSQNPKVRSVGRCGTGENRHHTHCYTNPPAKKQAKKVLIVAPLRVAKFVWPSEINNWEHLHQLRHVVLHGSKKYREELLNTSCEIHIINKEMVTWLVEEMSKRGHWPYDTIVIDESTCEESKIKTL